MRPVSAPFRSGVTLVPTLFALVATCAAAETAPAPGREPAPSTDPASTAGEAAAAPAFEGGTLTVAAEHERLPLAEPVQATKLDLALQDTPQSVVVVDQQLLQAQGFFSLRDALRNVPGLTMTAGENSRTGDRLNIRGFTADNDLYTDGLRDNGQYFRDTFNAQQVEVLKGPSAVLFGRGATGGAVNTVTKRPTDEWQGDLSITGGSDDLVRGQVGVGGPVVADTLGLRLDAFAQENDSFRDEQHVERLGVAPTAVVDLTPTTALRVQYLHQQERSTVDYGIPSFNGAPADVDISNYYGFADESFQEYDTSVATVALENQLSDRLKLTNAFRYGEYDRYYMAEPMGAVTFNVANPELSTVARTQSLRAADQRTFINQNELSYKGSASGRDLTAVLGVELLIEHYETKTRTGTGIPPVSIFNPQSPRTSGANLSLDSGTVVETDTDASTVSGYALVAYEFIPTLTAIVGARADRFSASYRSGSRDMATGAYTPTAALPSADQTDNLISPRAALVWEPVDELSVYASSSTSFNPSAESFAPTAATAGVDPEKSVNYEVGAKADLIDHRLAITGAVFRLEKTNQRTIDPLGGTANLLDGESHVDGVELGAEGRITDRFNLFAGVALMDSEVDRSNNTATPTPTFANPTPAPVSIEGMELVNVPEVSGSLWATFDLGWHLTLGGGAFYVGERWADTVNSVEIPDYVRFDASLAWARRIDDLQWFAQLNVFNLLDEIYYDGFGSGNRIAPGAPLTGQVTVGARF
jgi:catecholate siderophore receptor